MRCEAGHITGSARLERRLQEQDHIEAEREGIDDQLSTAYRRQDISENSMRRITFQRCQRNTKRNTCASTSS